MRFETLVQTLTFQALLEWPIRFVMGDDIFVSYSRQDGATYAAGLASALTEKGFECRIDQWGSLSGSKLPPALRRALQRSTVLVLVGTPAAARSEHVYEEVRLFRESGRPIVPILFSKVAVVGNRMCRGDVLTTMSPTDIAAPPRWSKEIEGLAISCEDDSCLASGAPSAGCLSRVHNTFTFTRKNERLRVASRAAMILLVLSAAGVAGLTGLAYWQTQNAFRATVTATRMGERAAKSQEQAAEAEMLAARAKEELDRTNASLVSVREALVRASEQLDSELARRREGEIGEAATRAAFIDAVLERDFYHAVVEQSARRVARARRGLLPDGQAVQESVTGEDGSWMSKGLPGVRQRLGLVVAQNLRSLADACSVALRDLERTRDPHSTPWAYGSLLLAWSVDAPNSTPWDLQLLRPFTLRNVSGPQLDLIARGDGLAIMLRLEVQHRGTVFNNLLLKNGVPRPVVEFEEAAKQSLVATLGSGVDLEDVRSAMTDTRTWQRFRQFGAPTMNAELGPRLGQFRAAQVIHAYTAVSWWSEAMSDLANAFAKGIGDIQHRGVADRRALHALEARLQKPQGVAARQDTFFFDVGPSALALDLLDGQRSEVRATLTRQGLMPVELRRDP